MKCFGTTISCRTRLSFLHFPPLFIILLFCPLFTLALWLIHLPPRCVIIPISSYTYFVHSSSKTFFSSIILFSHLSLHHSLFPKPNPFSFISHPLLFHVFFVFILRSPVFLPPSSPHFLHLFHRFLSSSSPRLSLLVMCVYCQFYIVHLSHIPVFLFHPSSKTHSLVPTPSLICHFSLLLSTSPRLGLVRNHNFIAFPLKLCSHTHPPPPVSGFCCH